jgi:parallel beta-helix repeat protein
MAKWTRRDFLKRSSVTTGALAIASTCDLWAKPEDAAASKATFYVATNGSDDWSGKLAEPNAAKSDGPFATLERARNAGREQKGKQATNQAITVMVRGGKYFLERTFTLGQQDSGGQGFPVRYQAYQGEEVILSGGTKISDWKVYKGQILQTSLSGTKGGEWKFRQLFLNGERQRRSRYPKYDAKNPLYGGWLFAEGPAEKGSASAFIYKPESFPHRWAKPQMGDVYAFPGGGWVDATLPIKSFNEQTRTITAEHKYRNPDVAPWYWPGVFRPGDRFRVENLLEELTEPGEWCLDSEEGILYFWPNTPLKAHDEVVAPVLQTLVDIDGASWIAMSGFTFTETAGGDDLHRFGLDGYGAMYPNQDWKYCGDALHLKDAEHCLIENNRFYAVGGNAIYLERYTARNVIRRNEIAHVGANGISLLGNHVPINSVSQPMMDRQPMPVFNEVTDNHIHHCGVLNKYIAGVFLGVSDSNLIAHNEIEYLPHHAVNLSMNGYGRNILEYNDIRQVCLELRDNGAINAWMDDPQSDERAGHVIRFNRMVDMVGCHTDDQGHILVPDAMAHGIYLDNNSSNCLIQGNVIVRCSGYGVEVHGGAHNLIENNIFVDASATSLLPGIMGNGQLGFNGYVQPAFLTGNEIRSNIFYFQKGKSGDSMGLLCFRSRSDDNQRASEMTNAISESQQNVLFRHDGGDYVVIEDQRKSHSDATALPSASHSEARQQGTLSLAEWQALGFDTDSKVDDPMFVDPAHDDYRLKPESPALSLGFVPTDVTKIGIRRSN